MHHFISDYDCRFKDLTSRSLPTGVNQRQIDLAATEPLFNDFALELFSWQFERILPYARFCAVRGVTPGRVRTWRDIPALPAGAFKDFEITSIPPQERTTVFYSSGTTTTSRSRHFHNPDTLAIYRASLLPWFQRHLLPDGSMGRPAESERFLLILTPPPESAPNSSLVHMFGSVATTFAPGCARFVGRTDGHGWTIDFAEASAVLSQSQSDHRRVILLGTAFSFVQLLDSLANANLRFELPAGSRVMETGGYKGRSRVLAKSDLRQSLRHRLGIRPANIVSEYGMSELSSQAYDGIAGTAEERLFQFPPWVRVQIMSPETGTELERDETGLIRVFDLANAGSIMAIQTEDLGMARGSGFELLGRGQNSAPRGCSLMTATAD